MSYIYKPIVSYKRVYVAEVTSISSPASAVPIFKQMLGPIEKFGGIFLNVRNNMVEKIIFEEMFSGTVGQCAVFSRNLMEMAILTHSSRLIICHNHPSGAVIPSPADDEITKLIKDGGKLLGIELMDALIIAEDNLYYSYMEQGRSPF